MGHSYIGHSYVSHSYISHSYMGHNYVDHNYIYVQGIALRGGGFICRSDSNGEDMEGYAGAGLYDRHAVIAVYSRYGLCRYGRYSYGLFSYGLHEH